MAVAAGLSGFATPMSEEGLKASPRAPARLFTQQQEIARTTTLPRYELQDAGDFDYAERMRAHRDVVVWHDEAERQIAKIKADRAAMAAAAEAKRMAAAAATVPLSWPPPVAPVKALVPYPPDPAICTRAGTAQYKSIGGFLADVEACTAARKTLRDAWEKQVGWGSAANRTAVPAANAGFGFDGTSFDPSRLDAKGRAGWLETQARIGSETLRSPAMTQPNGSTGIDLHTLEPPSHPPNFTPYRDRPFDVLPSSGTQFSAPSSGVRVIPTSPRRVAGAVAPPGTSAPAASPTRPATTQPAVGGIRLTEPNRYQPAAGLEARSIADFDSLLARKRATRSRPDSTPKKLTP